MPDMSSSLPEITVALGWEPCTVDKDLDQNVLAIEFSTCWSPALLTATRASVWNQSFFYLSIRGKCMGPDSTY